MEKHCICYDVYRGSVIVWNACIQFYRRRIASCPVSFRELWTRAPICVRKPSSWSSSVRNWRPDWTSSKRILSMCFTEGHMWKCLLNQWINKSKLCIKSDWNMYEFLALQNRSWSPWYQYQCRPKPWGKRTNWKNKNAYCQYTSSGGQLYAFTFSLYTLILIWNNDIS